ncbi:hypothetical protein F1728_22975 [Gimesia benthica]|uniref:Uncharacterized protein n=1 Tax=Gimesia benthica TaxID=2608982 RepID=A0A6I6AJX0_9PLAN|nr:hypothetical protein [Gimesia benthica]QGQ25371.1 hypothetical protein F1728_22975 [Gimesia benthica]
MTEGSKQPVKYTSDFNGLEKWFTHSIRRLKLSSILIDDIMRDERNPVECASTRMRLDEFASDCTDHSWEKAALDNFDSSGLSQVVVDIKRANGKQISYKRHQVEIDKETFNTAVEALIHLLRLISNLRHGFFSDKAYRSELYDEHKAEHGEEAADEFKYNYIRFHVGLLSEYGLNVKTIIKLKEVFELQKFGYLSAADEKGKLDSEILRSKEESSQLDSSSESNVKNVNSRKKSPEGDVLDLCMHLRDNWEPRKESQLARKFFEGTPAAKVWLSKLNMARKWKELWHPDHM